MKKKSKYKARHVIKDVMSHLKLGMTKLSTINGGMLLTKTMIINHEAIEALRKGECNKKDMDALINAFNVCEALAIRGIGNDYRDEIRQGQDSLMQICVRSQKVNKFIATGPELNAINTTMEIHDQQLNLCTLKELETAIDYVVDQIQKKKVRKVPVPL